MRAIATLSRTCEAPRSVSNKPVPTGFERIDSATSASGTVRLWLRGRTATATLVTERGPVSHTPEHAIREWLAGPDLKGSEGRSLPFRALPDTVRFVKTRKAPHRQLWYVTCDADGGPRGEESWHWTVLVSHEERDRWRAHSVAGGAGELPARGFPWANLGGNWGRDGFRAGGTVEDAGEEVTLVRLTDAEGRSFEDTVDDGVVLFISDEAVAMPMRVDLINAEGHVVGSDEWGFVDE